MLLRHLYFFGVFYILYSSCHGQLDFGDIVSADYPYLMADHLLAADMLDQMAFYPEFRRRLEGGSNSRENSTEVSHKDFEGHHKHGHPPHGPHGPHGHHGPHDHHGHRFPHGPPGHPGYRRFHKRLHSRGFSFGKNVVILFEGWSNLTWCGYFISCIFIFGLSVALEALKTLSHTYPSVAIRGTSHPHEPTIETAFTLDDPLPSSVVNMPPFKLAPAHDHAITYHPTSEHITKTMLYASTNTLSFLLMLIVMTFNIGLFVSIIAGLTTGYFLFGVARMRK